MSFNLNRWGRQTDTLNSGRILLQNGNPDNCPALFTYASSTDTISQIEAANYFSEAVYDLSIDDVIYASGTDAEGIYYVSTIDRAAGTISLTNIVGSTDGTINPGTANELAYYATTGTTISGLATANNSTLVTNGSGVPSLSQALPSAVQVAVGSLNSGTSASASTFWRGDGTWAIPAAAGVSSITGTASQVLANGTSGSAQTGAVTLTTPQNIATTSSPTFNALTLTTPLAIASGGTAVSSVTTSPTASAWAGWDANSNFSASNLLNGYATTATAAGTTALTVASKGLQFFTGSTTQTVTMPDVTTLALGQSYTIVNLSSGVVTVQSSGANTIQAMAANTQLRLTCIALTGTGTASWYASYSPQSVSYPLAISLGGTGVSSVTTSPTASAWAGWDANSNLSANNFLRGYATTATAAGTTTLTVASKGIQFFTGSTTQTVVLPDVSTLALGQSFTICNRSSGVVTVQSSGLNTIQAMAANTMLVVVCISLSGTGTSSWDAVYTPQSVSYPLAIGLGGTGVTSVTTAPTASAWSGWDANSNASANNFISGYATTATAAGTTTLTVASARLQFFTGSTTQTVTMPVTSTLVTGQQYMIFNNSTGVVTVQSSGANTIQALAPNTSLSLTCISTSGTGTSSWNWVYTNSGGGLILGYTTTATAAGTTTLDVSSTYLQYFTGSTTQTVKLPVVSTLTLGQQYRIVNNSTGVVTVQSSGSNTIVAMATLTEMIVTCISLSGTGTASWSWEYMAWQNVNGTTIGSDATISGLRVGKGGNANTSNTCVGNNALNTANTGTGNTCIGYITGGALANSSGNNTLVGYAVMGIAGSPGGGNSVMGQACLGSASFTGTNNTGVGSFTIPALTSGGYNSSTGYQGLQFVTTGSNNTAHGALTGTTTVGGANLTTGGNNTFIGYAATGNNSATAGAIAIGYGAVTAIATGATSSDSGPGIAFGASATPVGFRGDGTIYPSTTGAGFWRPIINGTAYLIPLIASGATGWPAITAPSITFSSTSGVIGTTTNDSAAAGSVGELIESIVLVGSAVSMASSGTTYNIASVSLTAGDWDVWAEFWTNPAGSTTSTVIAAAITTTSATLPTVPATNTSLNNTSGCTFGAGVATTIPVASCRQSLSGTTTVYLVANATFAVSTMGGYGKISARRRR